MLGPPTTTTAALPRQAGLGTAGMMMLVIMMMKLKMTMVMLMRTMATIPTIAEWGHEYSPGFWLKGVLYLQMFG